MCLLIGLFLEQKRSDELTLQELLDSNCTVIGLDIDVRDNGKLVESYEIGQYACRDKILNSNGTERWKTIQKPINNDKQSMRQGGGFNPKYNVVPKKLREMQVSYWRARCAGHALGLDMITELRVCLEIGECVPDVEKNAKPRKKEIEGQTSIEDYLKL